MQCGGLGGVPVRDDLSESERYNYTDYFLTRTQIKFVQEKLRLAHNAFIQHVANRENYGHIKLMRIDSNDGTEGPSKDDEIQNRRTRNNAKVQSERNARWNTLRSADPEHQEAIWDAWIQLDDKERERLKCATPSERDLIGNLTQFMVARLFELGAFTKEDPKKFWVNLCAWWVRFRGSAVYNSSTKKESEPARLKRALLAWVVAGLQGKQEPRRSNAIVQDLWCFLNFALERLNAQLPEAQRLKGPEPPELVEDRIAEFETLTRGLVNEDARKELALAVWLANALLANLMASVSRMEEDVLPHALQEAIDKATRVLDPEQTQDKRASEEELEDALKELQDRTKTALEWWGRDPLPAPTAQLVEEAAALVWFLLRNTNANRTSNMNYAHAKSVLAMVEAALNRTDPPLTRAELLELYFNAWVAANALLPISDSSNFIPENRMTKFLEGRSEQEEALRNRAISEYKTTKELELLLARQERRKQAKLEKDRALFEAAEAAREAREQAEAAAKAAADAQAKADELEAKNAAKRAKAAAKQERQEVQAARQLLKSINEEEEEQAKGDAIKARAEARRKSIEDKALEDAMKKAAQEREKEEEADAALQAQIQAERERREANAQQWSSSAMGQEHQINVNRNKEEQEEYERIQETKKREEEAKAQKKKAAAAEKEVEEKKRKAEEKKRMIEYHMKKVQDRIDAGDDGEKLWSELIEDASERLIEAERQPKTNPSKQKTMEEVEFLLKLLLQKRSSPPTFFKDNPAELKSRFREIQAAMGRLKQIMDGINKQEEERKKEQQRKKQEKTDQRKQAQAQKKQAQAQAQTQKDALVEEAKELIARALKIRDYIDAQMRRGVPVNETKLNQLNNAMTKLYDMLNGSTTYGPVPISQAIAELNAIIDVIVKLDPGAGVQ